VVALEAEAPENGLRTERLAFEPLAPRFADALFALLDDWDVVRMLSEVPWPLRLDDVAAFLAKPSTGSDDFVLVAEGVPIGVVGVKKPGSGEPPRMMPRLGYWIGRRHWGRGYGTEAIAALIDHAFAIHPHDRVGAGVFHDNPASRRVLEKLGLVLVGRKQSMSRSRGVLVDTLDMQLSRAAWEESRR
jgi:RimJ/RimL family protein N-acetyltransferase